MDFLKDLNVVEILKVGAIGLGFLLALMAYNIIKKEQEKDKPNTKVLSSARGFMVFSIVMMLLGIFAEFIKAKPYLKVKLGNNVMELNEISYASASALDPAKYFISSEYGFAFKKPGPDWSAIDADKGVEALFKIMAVKSESFTIENIKEAFAAAPLGKLITNGALYYFYNVGSKTNIEITDNSGNDLIDALVLQHSKDLLDTAQLLSFDTTKPDEKQDYHEELTDYRRELLGVDSLEAKNGFLLSIYAKSDLPPYLKKLKLPGFYNSISTALGFNADKLVANDKQILSGAEIVINNVKMKNAITTFQNKKWMMFTENEKYFFVVEIAYSPQISASVNIWDDLQETLNSFTLIKQ